MAILHVATRVLYHIHLRDLFGIPVEPELESNCVQAHNDGEPVTAPELRERTTATQLALTDVERSATIGSPNTEL